MCDSRAMRAALDPSTAFLPMLLVLVLFASGSTVAAQEQPSLSAGTTSWEVEVRIPAEIVATALFDPQTPGVSLPRGLSFIRARDIQSPPLREPLDAHLREHPDHAEWALSFIEVIRMEDLLIDGRAPVMPDNGAVGIWLAPVNTSQLAEAIPADSLAEIIDAAQAESAVVTLGFWVPDREYVNYMLEKGDYAEYGMVTLVEDDRGIFQGAIQLDDLHVESSAKPQGEPRQDTGSFTQLMFPPGDDVASALVINVSTPRHVSTCDGKWSIDGTHPLASAVLFGPTVLISYESPSTATGYRRPEQKMR